jgi:hypothetical protein
MCHSSSSSSSSENYSRFHVAHYGCAHKCSSLLPENAHFFCVLLLLRCFHNNGCVLYAPVLLHHIMIWCMIMSFFGGSLPAVMPPLFESVIGCYWMEVNAHSCL